MAASILVEIISFPEFKQPAFSCKVRIDSKQQKIGTQCTSRIDYSIEDECVLNLAVKETAKPQPLNHAVGLLHVWVEAIRKIVGRQCSSRKTSMAEKQSTSSKPEQSSSRWSSREDREGPSLEICDGHKSPESMRHDGNEARAEEQDKQEINDDTLIAWQQSRDGDLFGGKGLRDEWETPTYH
ncbi:hypothetical protein Ancab_023426 [Ancistrocladus abbreviatus]